MTEPLALKGLEAFQFYCSSSLNRFARHSLTLHEASFQGRKNRNEDRVAHLQTSYGFLVAVFDGHIDDLLSQYASAHLLNAVDRRISHSLNGLDFGVVPESIPDCIQEAISDFDKALIERAESLLKTACSKPFDEWEYADIYDCLTVDGKKAMGEDDPYPVVRRALVGSCVLLCVVAFGVDEHKMWTASLGDSEGYLRNSERSIVAINELHNTSNPKEVERLRTEHPNEEDVVSDRGYTRDELQITRALGDATLKVPLDFAKGFSNSWGNMITREIVDGWAASGHTPPYISSTATMEEFVVHKGDILILASDGLRSVLENKNISSDAMGDSFFKLAGFSGAGSRTISSLENSLLRSFIPPAQNSNLAELIIKNALFGQDKKLLHIATARDHIGNYRDDISVVVVQF